jgi:phage terminase large subunit-like protein
VSFDATDLAALGHFWEAWARPKQLPPETNWRSFGFVTGRGFGKTRSNCETVIAEIMAGRTKYLGFAAQNLDVAERAMVNGPDGLITRSPPWFRPVLVKGQLIWPNGAVATALTPEVPNGPRNFSFDTVWLAEIAAWPASTRDEFMSNIRYALRLGLGRALFDTTPKARNPLVRNLIERSVRDPRRHVLVRGSTHENQENLTEDFVRELEAEYGGTQRGREELEGQFFDDAEGSLFKQEWIDRARRDMPTVFKRRAISVDPAISMRKGTDATGIVDLGLGEDDQVFVLGDHTKRLAWEVWGALVIDLYVRGGCDCVIVERNRGGDAVVANLRACAERRGIRVEVVGPDAPTRRAAAVVYVKETISRKSKALRAEPVATVYERGRVSHVEGVDLTELEDQMTTWLPEAGGESPNALDALVHGVHELAGLSRETKPKSDVVGAAKLQAMVTQPRPSAPTNVAALLGRRGGGDRI